jgi:hypothetical protein
MGCLFYKLYNYLENYRYIRAAKWMSKFTRLCDEKALAETRFVFAESMIRSAQISEPHRALNALIFYDEAPDKEFLVRLYDYLDHFLQGWLSKSHSIPAITDRPLRRELERYMHIEDQVHRLNLISVGSKICPDIEEDVKDSWSRVQSAWESRKKQTVETWVSTHQKAGLFSTPLTDHESHAISLLIEACDLKPYCIIDTNSEKAS